MNKLTLIVFLAICLISAHSFVRRDAPAEGNTENYVEKIQKDLANAASQISKDIEKALNPETVKENFNKLVDAINQTYQGLQPKPQQ